MHSAQACPLCGSSFGVLLWRHECSTCHAVVCDNCAPKKKNVRVCRKCLETAKRRCASACNKAQEKPSDDGKAMCLRAAEERRLMELQRTQPQNQSTKRGSHIPSSPSVQVPSKQNEDVADVSQPTSPARETGCNPILEAAMRRRQQEQLGANGGRVQSAEKTQLLTDILSILHRRGEEEPFGLRSMDELKLRMYLRYMKDKDMGHGTIALRATMEGRKHTGNVAHTVHPDEVLSKTPKGGNGEKEEIQVGGRLCDGDDASPECPENIEVGGCDSALTLTSLAIWDAEITRRGEETMADVKRIRDSLNTLRASVDYGIKLSVAIGDAPVGASIQANGDSVDLNVTRTTNTELLNVNTAVARAIFVSECEDEDNKLPSAATANAECHNRVAIDLEDL